MGVLPQVTLQLCRKISSIQDSRFLLIFDPWAPRFFEELIMGDWHIAQLQRGTYMRDPWFCGNFCIASSSSALLCGETQYCGCELRENLKIEREI